MDTPVVGCRILVVEVSLGVVHTLVVVVNLEVVHILAVAVLQLLVEHIRTHRVNEHRPHFFARRILDKTYFFSLQTKYFYRL